MVPHENLIIVTADLTSDKIPSGRMDWARIIKFASTFDPKLETVGGSRVSGVQDVDFASTVSDLRMALYTEWRRWNHFGADPEPAIIDKSIQILGWIHDKVPPS
jgi:hypothetical protein